MGLIGKDFNRDLVGDGKPEEFGDVLIHAGRGFVSVLLDGLVHGRDVVDQEDDKTSLLSGNRVV